MLFTQLGIAGHHHACMTLRACMLPILLSSFALCADEEGEKQPFELFEAKGEAHPLLTGAKLWSESSGVGFDLRIRIRYRHYGEKEMVHWTLKTAARDRLSDEEWDKFDEEVTAKERMPYQAWASVILHDETY